MPRSKSKRKTKSAVGSSELVRPLPETPLQEIDRMRKIMRHYMRLTHVSRLHVRRLATAYEWEDLPQEMKNS
jgi:hypothetical protein